MTYMPIDNNNVPIPVLSLRAGGAHKLEAGAVAVKNVQGFDALTRVVSVYAQVPVYMNFGGADVSVDASAHYYPAGVYYNFSLGGGKVGHCTHLAVMAVGDAGAVYVSEKV